MPTKSDPFNPLQVIRHISQVIESNAIITTDVGQHQMWVAQVYPFKYPRTLLTSGGLGTMGFGLPAAIGSSLANPDRTVVCISGDGSFLMNIQELATLADHNLPVKIIILNNNHLGLVRQQQEMFYDSNIYASKFITNPNFAAIGKEFGINSYNLDRLSNPYIRLTEALTEPDACLINVPIDHELDVMPIVPPGGANYDMIGGEIWEK